MLLSGLPEDGIDSKLLYFVNRYAYLTSDYYFIIDLTLFSKLFLYYLYL